MLTSIGYAVHDSKSSLLPFKFERREPRENDVQIEILFSGICHSDIHQVRNEWGGSRYPMVPGHEIVGRISRIGSRVTKFKVGDLAGVGCMVDSCRNCSSCGEGLEQYCENGATFTYNGVERDTKLPTFGGYSNNIVVDQAFALSISTKLNLAGVAPLLCAGITTYSPLRHWKVSAGQKVGVVGLGGLGHMGVKFSAALGCHTVVLTHSEKKREDALRLGAKEVIVTHSQAEMKKHTKSFDFILDTVSAKHDLNQYLGLLKRDGAMVLVGLPETGTEVSAFSLVGGRRTLAGSSIGGISETQAMLDFCAEHNIIADVEVIAADKINEAYERMLKNDVKYRFVIDAQTIKGD